MRPDKPLNGFTRVNKNLENKIRKANLSIKLSRFEVRYQKLFPLLASDLHKQKLTSRINAERIN